MYVSQLIFYFYCFRCKLKYIDMFTRRKVSQNFHFWVDFLLYRQQCRKQCSLFICERMYPLIYKYVVYKFVYQFWLTKELNSSLHFNDIRTIAVKYSQTHWLDQYVAYRKKTQLGTFVSRYFYACDFSKCIGTCRYIKVSR